jgi:hypothetical protein
MQSREFDVVTGGIWLYRINNIAWLLRHCPVFAIPGFGRAVHDVILTKEEVDGLMAGLLVSESAPTGWTHLSQWISRHAHLWGMCYASELNRHFREK